MTIYSDYLKRKSQNAIRFGYSDEYPCILKNSKGKDLKNYQISGNSIRHNKNLIPYPYRSTAKSVNGVTYTDNGDGSVMISGTATADAYFYFTTSQNGDTVPKGVYTLSGGNSSTRIYMAIYKEGKRVWQKSDSDNSLTVDLTIEDYDTVSIFTAVLKNNTIDGIVIKPQLELGEVATEWVSQVPTFENPIEIKSIGEKTKNLIPYPYTSTTKTENGITFMDTGDGSVIVNGTATANTFFTFNQNLENIDITKKYVLSGSSNISVYVALYQDNTWKKEIHSRNGNPAIIDFPSYTDVEYNRISIHTYVPSGKTVNNVIVKPQLELGETASEYEPYNKYKIPIICRGKNVFDITKCYHYDSDKKAMFIPESSRRDNNEGKVNLITNMQAGHTYIITGNSTSSSGYFVYLNGTQTVWQWGKIYTPTQADIDGSIYFYKHTESEAPEGVTDVTITNVQIEEAMISSDYEEYQAPITTNIYLDKPLKGLSDKQDVIDFKNQKVIQNVDEIILNGTENWTSNVSSSITHDVVAVSLSKFKFGNTSKALMSTGRFNAGYYNVDNYIGFTSWSQDQNTLMYRKDGITVDNMKELLQNQNTKIVGILKNPIESSIDLSKLPTLKGTTICEINSNIIPRSMSIKYVRN